MSSPITSLLLLAIPWTVDAQAPAAVKPAEVAAVQRIAVLGASLSEGFRLYLEVGARTTLSDVVEASLLVAHGPIHHGAANMLFANPMKIGGDSASAARAKDPTLVVALDFAFWFGYGAVRAEGERVELLEKGLGLLSGFECPVLVGDFPDLHDAIAGTTPETAALMLAAEQVPQAETIVKLNERLRAWAASRKNVVVVPVADLHAHARAGEEVAVRGNRWFKGSSKALVQSDRLHPTLEGTIALWICALDALVSAREDVPASAFDWDWKSIHRKVFAGKEKERQAAFDKQKKKIAKPPPEPAQPAGKGKERVPNRLGETGGTDRDG